MIWVLKYGMSLLHKIIHKALKILLKNHFNTKEKLKKDNSNFKHVSWIRFENCRRLITQKKYDNPSPCYYLS